MSLDEEIRVIKEKLDNKVESHRIEVDTTEEDVLRWGYEGLKIGDKKKIINPLVYKDFQTFHQFFIDTKCYGIFYGCILNFKKIYTEINERAITEELREIEKFITETNTIELKKALQGSREDAHYEYLRVTDKFYYKTKFKNSNVIKVKDGNKTYEIKAIHDIYFPYADVVYGRYVLYKDWLLEKKKAFSPQQAEKPKSESKKTPKTFNELFYNTELVQPSIDILKEIEPPLIDTDYNYIGKLKGIICVWIDELQRQGIIKHYSDRKIFAALIPQKIKRFSIDESMFGKFQTKAETNYRTDIKTKVSKIKLSQNSQ